MTVGRAGAATIGVVAALGTAALMRRATAGRARWERTNFRGRPVSLAAGPAVAAGAALGAACTAPGALFCGCVAGALGLYDDLYGDTHARGLAGHARALAQGRVTTGLVKLAGLVGAGALSSTLRGHHRGRVVSDAVLVAGAANLVNLLDLRPGRALKVVAAVGTLAACVAPRRAMAARSVAAGCVGAAAATLPADLAEHVMIGDCGANTLGALLGWSMANGLSATGRRLALTAVVALTLASERVSFTKAIETTPWLRAVDEWGRAG